MACKERKKTEKKIMFERIKISIKFDSDFPQFLLYKLFKVFSFLVIVFALSNCAKQVAPSGGPVDKTPPTVIATNPENETTNFNGDEIDITFSEYVDKSSVRSAIFISPTINNKSFDWSGKEVAISFTDTLKRNTTYTVIVGTGVKDLNNRNKMASPYIFSFSTGGKIDKGKIKGRLFDRNPKGVMIFAYREVGDTINPAKQKPDFISESGEDGKFELTGLSNGKYRIFAVNDKNGNLLFDSANEKIGIQSEPYLLTDSIRTLGGVNFQLTSFDTTKPELLEATMTDKNHILAEYSKPVDSSKISSENFSIYDSTKRVSYPVLYAYKGKVKGGKVLLELDEKLPEKNRLFLIGKNLFDYYGNVSKSESVEFYYNDKPDTTKPEILKISRALNKKIDYADPHFTIFFSEGICSFDLGKKIIFSDRNNITLPIKTDKVNDAEFNVNILSELHPNEKYNLTIKMSELCDAAGNKGDSSIVKSIETINDLAFVSVEGKVVNDGNNFPIYVVLEGVKDKSEAIKKVERSGKYLFEKVLPGNYFVWAFSDKNNNGKYDLGSVVPFRYSEPFAFRSDTIIVKPRWPIKDVNIKFE